MHAVALWMGSPGFNIKPGSIIFNVEYSLQSCGGGK